MSSPPLSYRFMLPRLGGEDSKESEIKSRNQTLSTQNIKNVIFHTYEKQQATLSWHIIIRWQHFCVCATAQVTSAFRLAVVASPSSTFSFHVLDVSGMIYSRNYFSFIVVAEASLEAKWRRKKLLNPRLMMMFGLWSRCQKSFFSDKTLIDASAMSDRIKKAKPSSHDGGKREKRDSFAVRKQNR